jgi:hypothetical protein
MRVQSPGKPSSGVLLGLFFSALRLRVAVIFNGLRTALISKGFSEPDFVPRSLRMSAGITVLVMIRTRFSRGLRVEIRRNLR